jgi:hypothetical protein
MKTCSVCNALLKPLWGAVWFCPNNCDKRPVIKQQETVQHISGYEVLVVRKPEDRPLDWRYATWANDNNIMLKDVLLIPLSFWVARSGVSDISPYLAGQRDTMQNGVFYLYILP